MKNRYIFIFTLVITLFSSCDDFLTVEPKDMVTVDKALDTPSGYTSAIIGVYQLLQTAYSPGGFLMGSGADIMANIYAEPSYTFSASLNSAYHFDFSDTNFDSASGVVFLQLYNAIANLNILLENIETKDVLSGKERDLIEGEAKALRAFIHFDLWRLYGTMPGDEAGDAEAVLPYSSKVSTTILTYSTYSEYFAYILSDLEDAKVLLAQSDPILTYNNEELNTTGSIDEYVDFGWYNRQNRFNYYATLGELARVELWMGNHSKAFEYAKEVVEAVNSDGSSKFKLGTSDNSSTGDFALFNEHLFGIETTNYDDISYSSYDAVCVNSDLIIKMVYPNAEDIRYKNFFQTLEGNALVNTEDTPKTSLKYSKMTELDVAPKSFPIIRLSEMYLIMTETAESLSQAQQYFDAFINTRNDNITVLTADNRKEIILNQYMREFWSEGQLFYTYKRMNLELLPISGQEMTADKYRVRKPLGESTSL